MKFLFTSLTLAFFFAFINESPATAAANEEKIGTLLTEFSYVYKSKPRAVPIKIYYPKNSKVKNIPVIIMSHGLGGTREIGEYLGMTWAKNRFVVVAMQHEGSDRNAIKGRELDGYMKVLRKAISPESYLKRIDDVSATIDQVTKWNSDKSHPLFDKADMNEVGMCGHSFGAVTTQAVSGQWNPLTGLKFTDKRIKAAFAMSPSIPKKWGKPSNTAAEKAFAKVTIPWLLMTGTEDTAIVTPNVTPESRKKVYENLPAGDKYQLVLGGATHMAFSDRQLFGKKHRNPDHHKAIKAISTAFFQAYLKDGAKADKAQRWLQSDAVQKAINPTDSWEKK